MLECITLPGGGGALPYTGYIGMCSHQVYSFSAVMHGHKYRVSFLAEFGHLGHEKGIGFALQP